MALNPDMVANAFVRQYYSILTGSPDQAHKFYYDESSLGRPGSDGTMKSITTTRVSSLQHSKAVLYDLNIIHEAIKKYFISTDLKRCSMCIEEVDAQPSHGDGVFVVVTGFFTKPNAAKFRFAQSFFLAPQQGGGYFVMNDVLKYTPDEPKTPSVKENMDAQQTFHQGDNEDDTAENGSGDDEPGEMGDGQTCVICLRKRRKAAFVPCGHLVCCCNCAKRVELKDEPLCPVCRQDIHYVLRVYDS